MKEPEIRNKYKHLRYHPRLIEIEIAMMAHSIGTAYSIDGLPNDYVVKSLFQTICNISAIPFEKIVTIINNQYRILRDSKASSGEDKRIRFRQEAIFLGVLKGESRQVVAEKYLRLQVQTLYQEPRLRLENFVTDEWIDQLDDNIMFGGDKPLVNAGIELVKQMDKLRGAIGHVSVSKSQV
jgi:hypothetical protein